MKRRLFISLQIPETVKAAIAKELEKVRYDFTDDVRFIDPSEWHITVTFLDNQEDTAMPAILNAMAATAREFKAPQISFTDISYGPKKDAPRMIWLNGSLDSCRALQSLKDFLENTLVDNQVVFKREHRQLRIHITLARLMSAENLPALNAPFNETIRPEMLDLMESVPGKEKVTYEFLQKTPFKI